VAHHLIEAMLRVGRGDEDRPVHRFEELHMSTEIPAQAMGVAGRSGQRPWAAGLTLFAAAVMMISGVWHAFAGIGALMKDEVYVVTPRYLYSFDLTAWGWTLIVLGVVVAAAGFAILLGETWARVVGIVVASLSVIANFVFLPHYPFWSLAIIALDVAAIWALATYRSELV